MQRLFWGFIKIAIVIFVLVWASRQISFETTVPRSADLVVLKIEQDAESMAQKKGNLSEEMSKLHQKYISNIVIQNP